MNDVITFPYVYSVAGAKVAMYAGDNLHKKIVNQPSYSK